MKTVAERIGALIELDCLTANAFARKVGVDAGNLNKMLAGKQTITDSTLRKIADAVGCSFEWLKFGDGEMYARTDCKSKFEQFSNAEETRPRIPMSVAAGTLCGFAESVKAYDCEQVPVVKAFPEYDYTIIVKGDSMEPKFEGGDEIAIRKVAGIIEWGKPYVLDTADGAVLKRLYDNGDKFRCVSFNKEYPDFEVSKSDVFGVYKIVGLIRI